MLFWTINSVLARRHSRDGPAGEENQEGQLIMGRNSRTGELQPWSLDVGHSKASNHVMQALFGDTIWRYLSPNLYCVDDDSACLHAFLG